MVFALATAALTIVRLDLWLPLRARTHAERPALTAGGRTLTYAELEEAARIAARRLAALEVRPGDRVVTTLPPGVELASLLHATAKLGAVLAPVDSRLTAGERGAMVDAAAPRLVVDEPLKGEEADVELGTRVGAGEPWTLLFTSGTAGAPKPVLLTHGNHAAGAIASAWALGVAPGDRWLCVLPLFHVGGLAILVRSAVHGTVAIVHERFTAEDTIAALAAGHATLVSLVPTMLRRLADAGLETAPAVRAVLLGGASAPVDLLEWAARRDLPIVRTYGMTETASQVATAPGLVEASAGEPGSPPGARPLPGVELRIGEGGEILVQGPMVARGSLAADGWLHTGDRGRLDATGALHVEGRMDDVIVTGGENVAAPEVEEALRSHPGVADAAAAGVSDPEWGSAVAGYVVAAPGTVLDPAEVIEHCRGRLAGFKVPKRLRVVEELPRNAAGKLMRARLAEAVETGSSGS